MIEWVYFIGGILFATLIEYVYHLGYKKGRGDVE